MATYAKLPRVIQDFGLGYQSVNQAADNAQALWDTWDVEHGAQGAGAVTLVPGAGGALGGGGLSGSGVSSITSPRLGQHDDVKIPRGVAHVKHSTYTYAPGQISHFVHFEIVSATGALLSVERMASGFYFVRTAGLDTANVWAEVEPEANGAAVRFMNARYVSTINGAPYTGVIVMLQELAAGAFSPADFGFTLTVFSDRP